MKINKLHIDNFGGLHDFDLELNDNLNVLKRENGFGKTTLTIFIKAMLFGMPAGRENIKMERKKYMPWQGGNYGGFIDLQSEKGIFRLTRYFAKTPDNDRIEILDLSTFKKLEIPKNEIGEELFGIGKETFEITAFFSQANFNNNGSDKLGANLLGLDKFASDVANITDSLDKINKKIRQLKKDKPSEMDFSALSRRKREYELSLSDCQRKLKEVEEKLSISKDKLQNLEQSYIKQEEQAKKEENIIQSKLKFERELALKSDELNGLYLKLQELKENKVESAPAKKTKLPNIMLIISLVLLAVVDVVLFTLNIINLTIFIIITAVLVILSLFLAIVLIKRSKSNEKNHVEDTSEEKDISSKIATLKGVIDELKGVVKNYQEMNFFGGQNLDELKEEIYNNRNNKNRLDYELQTLKNNFESINEDIEECQEMIDAKREESNNIDKKIKLLTYANEYLKSAYENVSKRFVEPVNNAFAKLLKDFDLNERKFVVDSNFKICQDDKSGLKDFEYSSQGIKDLLSFCIRFYLIKELYKKEKPLVVLDDSFVNLDDKNFKAIEKLLKEFSKEFQILYICCNSRCQLN